MSETTAPSGRQLWGVSIRWLLVAGVALVLTATITTFGLRLIDPEPTVPTPTISPSPVVVLETPSPPDPFIVFPTDGAGSSIGSLSAAGLDVVPSWWTGGR